MRTLILLVCMIGCTHVIRENKIHNCKEINKYIKMEVSASKVVSMGDSLELNISYTNISDSLLTFYPMGFVSIIKPYEIIGIIASDSLWTASTKPRILHLEHDYRTLIIMQPGEKYYSHYSHKVTRALFPSRFTKIAVTYRINYDKDVRNELCGRIESNLIDVEIKTLFKN